MHVALLLLAGLNLLAVLLLCWILMPAREEEQLEARAMGFHFSPAQEEEDEDVC